MTDVFGAEFQTDISVLLQLNVLKEIKNQSHYRPGVTQKVPGS